jgi:predicted nucleic acid-binding protein
MKIMTCFIDATAWLAIIDKNHPNHEAAREYFSLMLEENAKLITNNVAIDQTLVQLKNDLGPDKARQFLNIIDESVLTINLRMDWISRRIRRNGLNQYLKSTDESLVLSHFLINETLKRKRADVVFSFDPALKRFGLPLMPQMVPTI